MLSISYRTALAVVAFASSVANAQKALGHYPYNALANTPQMGWDNFNAFGCNVSADLLLGTANKIASYGLRDAGYEYVILDDCWANFERNSTGHLEANATKFPDGMQTVADQVHALGLKFGMYSSAGTYTCARYPGSLGFETNDAQTFASWGVDYLKYDNCYNEGQSGTPLITYTRYKKMSEALLATGREILYSLCNWGEDYPWKWAQTMSNSWRMSGDIMDSFNRPDPRCPCTGDEGFNCALPGFHCSAMNILNKLTFFADKGIPGAWNDLDTLEVGNGGMDDEEYKTHFTMWAAVKSPLIMGNDIRNIKPESLSILLNPAIIAISKDPLGQTVFRRWRYYVPETDQYGQGEIQMWSGQLSGGDMLVILLNGGNSDRLMNATLTDVFQDDASSATKGWDLYDVWANRMPNDIATAVINGNATTQALNKYYLNATQTSYADALAANNPLVLGTKTDSVAKMGTIQVTVPRHGVKAYRMRAQANDKSEL